MIVLLFGVEPSVNWIDVVSKILPPFVALGGAISLYFLQRRKDRADALRAARLNLYSDYLHTLSKFPKSFVDAQPEQILEQFGEIGRLDDRVRVLAPLPVAKASKEVLQGLFLSVLTEVNSQEPELKVDLEKNLGENLKANLDTLDAAKAHRREFVEARKNLLKVMRSDLFSGTGEKASDIDNLWDEKK